MLLRNTGIRETVAAHFKSAKELGVIAPIRYRFTRMSSQYQSAFEEREPLVSICTATYNRPDLLISRCINSLISQTYNNIEIIVVGDGSAQETVERVSAVHDPRVRFVNLPRQDDYPGNLELRWMVAGANAINHAFSLARGAFITQLDDDDSHTPDRIEKLVSFMQEKRVDVAFHPFWWETVDGEWRLNEALKPLRGRVTSSAMMYHRWFVNHPHVASSILRFREPGDWIRMRKFRYLGARVRRHPDAMLVHYREQTQHKPPPVEM